MHTTAPTRRRTATLVVLTGPADANVAPGAELRSGYEDNAGGAKERFFGPADLANHSELSETRTTTTVVTHGAPTFRLRPHVRVDGANGKTATVGARCITVTEVIDEEAAAASAEPPGQARPVRRRAR